MSLLKLASTITENGMDQGALVRLLQNLVTVVTELQSDRTASDSIDTNLKALVNQLRFESLYCALGNPGFARNSNFDVANANAISYLNGGTLKTLSATTNFDTGTTATIATTKWNAALLTVNSSGSAVLTWANAAGGASYASEALAIAALAAPAATDTVLGYVTVQAAGITWTPGTDALQGGTGGTPATTTNYYNSCNPNTLMIGAAISDTPSSMSETGSITLSAG